MSYFPIDIPYMSKKELMENSIKNLKSVESKGGYGMITLTVYYTDGTHTEYICKKVRYDARLIFAETDDGNYIWIPYANVYVVIEEKAKE